MAHLRRISHPAAGLHAVESSVLRAVRYLPARRVLEVTFRSGRIYRYFDVPRNVYEKLLAAPSIGSYFNKTIRPNYRMESLR